MQLHQTPFALSWRTVIRVADELMLSAFQLFIQLIQQQVRQ
jgi:hypothetical protein